MACPHFHFMNECRHKVCRLWKGVVITMKIPQHVAIILDGNGRWAKSKGMPRNYGHTVGAKNVDRVSASKNYQRDKFKLDSPLQYYLKGRKYYILNEDTKAMLELLLVMLAVKGEDEVNHFLKYEVLKGKVPYEKEYLINLRKNLEKGSAYHLEEEQ